MSPKKDGARHAIGNWCSEGSKKLAGAGRGVRKTRRGVKKPRRGVKKPRSGLKKQGGGQKNKVGG